MWKRPLARARAARRGLRWCPRGWRLWGRRRKHKGFSFFSYRFQSKACYRRSIAIANSLLRDVFADVFVAGERQVIRVALKDHVDSAQNQKAHCNLATVAG